MALPRVFIDGHAGTTGLRIRDWLRGRDDLEVLAIDDAQRKDPAARAALSERADVVVLCLPDAAAKEAAAALSGKPTRVIDASTAHRTAEGWVFGLPELAPAARARIAAAPRVSNPGCYASAVILALRPLIDARLVPASAPIGVHALSGYSGGGRELIEKWQDPARGLLALPFEAPYALERVHKHLPEMAKYCGLEQAPQFVPAVGPFRCGMRVEIPLHAAWLPRDTTGKRVWEALAERYRDERFVRVQPYAEPPVFDDLTFDPRRCNDTNRIELYVVPNPAGHVLLVALLDNLGKGASGVAIQNLNLMLGLSEGAGLRA
jgi:N-acetyl-gamma-glutamyl-phosphate reductase